MYINSVGLVLVAARLQCVVSLRLGKFVKVKTLRCKSDGNVKHAQVVWPAVACVYHFRSG